MRNYNLQAMSEVLFTRIAGISGTWRATQGELAYVTQQAKDGSFVLQQLLRIFRVASLCINHDPAPYPLLVD